MFGWIEISTHHPRMLDFSIQQCTAGSFGYSDHGRSFCVIFKKVYQINRASKRWKYPYIAGSYWWPAGMPHKQLIKYLCTFLSLTTLSVWIIEWLDMDSLILWPEETLRSQKQVLGGIECTKRPSIGTDTPVAWVLSSKIQNLLKIHPVEILNPLVSSSRTQ